jgi:hypothetical protein
LLVLMIAIATTKKIVKHEKYSRRSRGVFSSALRSKRVRHEEYSRKAQAILIADDRNREKVPHSTQRV